MRFPAHAQERARGDREARALRIRRAASRILDYLESTEDRMGVDVLLALQIFGALGDDARAVAVARSRRDSPRPGELERYARLLEVAKPPFEPASLAGWPPPTTTPNPADELADDRGLDCLRAAAACNVTPPCIDYLELDDRWGYVLTHQAVTLLIARWVGCPLDVDVEERRRTFAANLVAEMRADPTPSELAYERMAMLGHLGFASAIEPAWIDALLDAQTAEGCFPVRDGLPCHPHPTGVALWALAHAIE